MCYSLFERNYLYLFCLKHYRYTYQRTKKAENTEYAITKLTQQKTSYVSFFLHTKLSVLVFYCVVCLYLWKKKISDKQKCFILHNKIQTNQWEQKWNNFFRFFVQIEIRIIFLKWSKKQFFFKVKNIWEGKRSCFTWKKVILVSFWKKRRK